MGKTQFPICEINYFGGNQSGDNDDDDDNDHFVCYHFNKRPDHFRLQQEIDR